MTRAKDISKIVTDADLSGTLDVTGAVTAGGLTVSGTAAINNIIDMTGSTANYIKAATSGGDLRFITNESGTNRQRVIISNNGDISFYEDTGTTAKFFWDASAESLAIGASGVDGDASGLYVLGADPTANEKGQLVLKGTATSGASGTGASIAFKGHNGFGSRSLGSIQVLKENSTAGNIDTYMSFVTRDNIDGQREVARLDSSGNVGIATNTAKLQWTSTNNKVALEGNSGDMLFYSGNSGYYERMRIDASGNVGIGTSSPSVPSGTALEIYGSSASRLKLSNSTTGTGSTDGFQIYASGSSAILEQKENAEMRFYTNATERMRIDNTGNLLVGKTTISGAFNTVGTELRSNGRIQSTISGDKCIDLNRLSSDGDIVEFFKDGSGVGSIGVMNSDNIFIDGATSHAGLAMGSSKVLPIQNGSEIDNVIDLGSSGTRFDDIYATNGTIQTSDQQEKNTITDSDLGIDFIKRLTPKSYIFNGKTRTHYGLIAQDVETVLSDISKPTSGFAGFIKTDISEEQDGSEYRYGLRYTEFVAPLIQAVKDQQATIDALTARITALENGV